MIKRVACQNANEEFGLYVLPWMWSKTGLGIGHGADLLVYAALYALTAQGTLPYDRPCSELAARLDYARETVQRSLTRLVHRDLIYSPDEKGASGTPRTYLIAPGPIMRACGHAAGATQAPMEVGATLAAQREHDQDDAAVVPTTTGTPQAVTGMPQDRSPQAGATGDKTSPRTHMTCDGLSQQTVTGCVATSDQACDPLMSPTLCHTQKLSTLPAETPVFNNAHISSYLSSNERTDMSGNLQVVTEAQPARDDAPSPHAHPTNAAVALAGEACTGTTGIGCTLGVIELAVFEALVSRSLLPVDQAFLGRNLEAFEALIASGVPADAVLQAYDDYARFQHKRQRETGEWRPMHLLHWLEGASADTGNVGYVMRARERDRSRGETPRQQQPTSPRTRRLRLTCCRDRGRAIWFADDDHGSRRVVGAEGIEDIDEVRAIYERMYQHEERTAA